LTLQRRGNDQGSHLVWMRIRLRTKYTLSMRCVRHKSESHHQKDVSNHRFISWREECPKEKPSPYISNDKFSQDS
jgi:hypothetical protein